MSSKAKEYNAVSSEEHPKRRKPYMYCSLFAVPLEVDLAASALSQVQEALYAAENEETLRRKSS